MIPSARQRPCEGELPVYVLTGPTGTGKSDWAVRLAEIAPIEIVSVDSALVYRGMDIGSAKPGRALRERVRHHLIDICDPTDNYSAGRFVTDATAAIAAIHTRGKVPLLVGGTMLYLRALMHGLAQLPEASPQIRRGNRRARGARRLVDPACRSWRVWTLIAAARINSADPQRIQRALEVCYMTGRPISELQRDTVSPLAGYPVRAWALAPANRAVLHERLETRFHSMLAGGFLDEVRSLRARGDLDSRHSSMRAVGYRQLWAHLAGEYDLEEAIRRGIFATRQLATRQLTWMRSEQSLEWLDPDISMLQASWNRDLSQKLRELGL